MATWEVDPSMTYYSEINLRNFRGFFRPKSIPLAPLTLLVGPNSSGKSSIFDAILLLAQSRFTPRIPSVQQPRWIGPLVDLGSYGDTVYQHKMARPIEITIQISSPLLHSVGSRRSSNANTEFKFKMQSTKNDPIGILRSLRIVDCISKESLEIKYSKVQVSLKLLGEIYTYRIPDMPSRYDWEISHYYPSYNRIIPMIDKILSKHSGQLFRRKAAWQRIQRALGYTLRGIMTEVERVSSGRAAPRRWYSITEIAGTSARSEFGNRVFSEVDPNMVIEAREERAQYHGRRRKRIPLSIESALTRLGIATSIKSSTLSPYHSTIDVKDSVTGVTSNLIDVGYGASQVIPVIRACMSPGRGPLLIEQPEIHLHPRAQSVIAEILCETSVDRQVIVETHSVHIINRVRVLIAEGKIDPHHVIINFVGRSRSGSNIHSIRILENGEFADQWPVSYGFFHERYHDTMHLLKLKQRKASEHDESSS